MPYLQTVVTHYINKQMPKLIFFISLLALLSCSDRKSKNKALEDFKDSINAETLSSSKPEKITSSKPEPVNVIKEINEPKFKDDSILVNGFLGLLMYIWLKFFNLRYSQECLMSIHFKFSISKNHLK